MDSKQHVSITNTVALSSTISIDWTAGKLRATPWMALVATFAFLSFAISSVVVLKVSDGQLVSSWRIPPTVFLALIAAGANASIHFVLSEGLRIAWWRKAMRGTTIGNLHRQWAFGDSLRASITAGRRINLTSLAHIMATTVLIVGPLLQRASTIENHSHTTLVNLTVRVANTFPLDWGGNSNGNRDWNIGSLQSEFSEVVLNYTKRTPISVGFQGCQGRCDGTVRALGISSSCASEDNPIDLSLVFVTSSDGILPPAAYVNQTYFAINFTASPWNSQVPVPVVNVTTSVLNFVNNKTVLSVTKCSLRLAIVDYPITVLNGTTTLRISDTNNTASTFASYYSNSNITEDSAAYIGALGVALSGLFASSATRWYSNTSQSWDSSTIGLTPNFYLDPTTIGMVLSNPTTDILRAADELTFRAAIKAMIDWEYWATQRTPYLNEFYTYYDPKEENKNKTLQVSQVLQQNIFISSFTYLYAALVVMLLSLICTSSTIYGWWELGRVVSLSPIETAHAFNAPVLRGESSSAEALVKELGDTRIRYGEVRSVHGTRIAAGDTSGEMVTSRLEFADPDLVRKPRAT